MEAVSHDGMTLRFIRKQSEAVCEAAIRQNPQAVFHVAEKTKRLRQMEQVVADPLSVLSMEDPSEELCCMAVRADWSIFELMEDPSERVCLEAVRQHGNLLAYVEEQTLPLCQAAVAQNPEAVRFVKPWYRDRLN